MGEWALETLSSTGMATIVALMALYFAIKYYKNERDKGALHLCIEIDKWLTLTREKIILSQCDKFIFIVEHLNRLEILASFIRRNAASKLVIDSCRDLIFRDLAGVLCLLEKEAEERVDSLITSNETYVDLMWVYERNKEIIGQHKAALQAG